MKTSELIGPTLDWAVCVAEGNSPVINPKRFGGTSFGRFESELGYAIKHYSTNWAQGGPIIEREIAVIRKGEQSAIWFASIMDASMDYMTYEGPTPLIAAMRCYVASKLGDEVEIPKEQT